MANKYVHPVKSFKTEILFSDDQRQTYIRTIGTLRYVYNLFIQFNSYLHAIGHGFMGGLEFSVWLNNIYLPLNPSEYFIKLASSKAVKKVIMNADAAYRRFFKISNDKEFQKKHRKRLKNGKYKQRKDGKPFGFPRYKKRGVDDPSVYFVNSKHKDGSFQIKIERHRIYVPIYGWVRLKEKGYFPCGAEVVSGSISKRADRFFMSILVKDAPAENHEVECDCSGVQASAGIGVDAGVRCQAHTSEDARKPNLNQTKSVRQMKRHLKRLHRRLKRQYDAWEKRCKEAGEYVSRKNYEKTKLEIQTLEMRLENRRDDYIRQFANELVRPKPAYIAIEDLNISGMMRNRHLAKHIAEQKLYFLRESIIHACKKAGVEARLVNRWYPSSKRCHNCGAIKHDLGTKKIYRCEHCGIEIDRDYNAALNLRDTSDYQVVA